MPPGYLRRCSPLSNEVVDPILVPELAFFPLLRRAWILRVPQPAMRESLGTVSLSNSSRLPANAGAMPVKPVIFPQAAQAINEPKRNRIKAAMKNDGDSTGSVFGGHCSGRQGRKEHINLETDQFISQRGKPFELIFSGSILEYYVLAFNIAECTELSTE